MTWEGKAQLRITARRRADAKSLRLEEACAVNQQTTQVGSCKSSCRGRQGWPTGRPDARLSLSVEQWKHANEGEEARSHLHHENVTLAIE